MNVINIPEELLDTAKNYLDITWDDEAADEKLSNSLRRGIAYISAKTGVSAEQFSGLDVNYRAQELLLNYVLYDRSGATAEFKKNYRGDLIALRMLWEVNNHETNAAD